MIARRVFFIAMLTMYRLAGIVTSSVRLFASSAHRVTATLPNGAAENEPNWRAWYAEGGTGEMPAEALYAEKASVSISLSLAGAPPFAEATRTASHGWRMRRSKPKSLLLIIKAY